MLLQTEGVVRMGKNDIYLLAILMMVPLLVFYPLFYSNYLFMDEAYQIWNYNTHPGFYMFTDDGRWLTELLQSRLFKLSNTTEDVKYIRLISLFGWILCLPIWYYVIKRIINNTPSYKYLPFFICLYLVTSLPFIVSVQWATCMQFFISNTCGLVSGALILQSIKFVDHRLHIARVAIIASVVLGVISLFTYQSGFACYLLPFLLHFISIKKTDKNRVLFIGLFFYFVSYLVYFILFKWTLKANHIPPYARTEFYFDPLEKLNYFVARPLERSFRFTLLTNETSSISKVYFVIMVIVLAVLAFIRCEKNWIGAIKYLFVINCLFLLSYLPCLIVKENWPSNRVQQALDLAVFIVCLEMALYFIKNRLILRTMSFALVIFFVFCAWSNFRNAFLHPQEQETAVLKDYIWKNYNNNVHTIYFIRPSLDYVSKKYHVEESMDEIGMGSTCFEWTPEPFTRQMIYEKTGNREEASRISFKHWPDKQSFLQSGEVIAPGTLLIDAPAIIDSVVP